MKLYTLILVEVGAALIQVEPPAAWCDDPPSAWVEQAPAPSPKAPLVREYWGGQWGWMERGADGIYRQATAGGAASQRPFPEGGSTPLTSARRAGGASTSWPGSTRTGRIITLAPGAALPGGTENCGPVG